MDMSATTVSSDSNFDCRRDKVNCVVLIFLALCLLCVTFVMPLVYFVACMQNTNSAMMFSKISLSGLFYLWSGLVMFMGLNKMFYKLNVSGDKKLYIHSI